MNHHFHPGLSAERQFEKEHPTYSSGTFSVPNHYLPMHYPSPGLGWQTSTASGGGGASIQSLLNSGAGYCSPYPTAMSALPTPNSMYSDMTTLETLSPVSATNPNPASPYAPMLPMNRSGGLGNFELRPDGLGHGDDRFVPRSSNDLVSRRPSSSSGSYQSWRKNSYTVGHLPLSRDGIWKEEMHPGRLQTPAETYAPHSYYTGSASVQDGDDDEDDDNESDVYNDTGKADDCHPRMLSGAASTKRQRERNRAAATKCRIKTKATIRKLKQDEKAMSDRHDCLFAEKSALMDEVLSLRLELLRHSKCDVDSNIPNYLHNAALMIGQTGGTHCIWGPDGSGKLWSVHDNGRTHDRSFT